VQDEDAGSDQEVHVPGVADGDKVKLEAADLEAYLAGQLGTGALAYGITSLSETLERVAAQTVVMPEFTKALDAWSAQQSQFDAAVRNLALSPALDDITRKLRVLDGAGDHLRLVEHWSTVADWSQRTLGFSALTSWRASLAAESRIEQVLAGLARFPSPQLKLIEGLASITQAQVHFTDWVVQQDASSHLLGEISGRPLGLWRSFMDDLPAEPDDQALRTSVTTGRVGLGLLGADVLQSEVADVGFFELAVQQVESDVLAPWDRERLRSAKELYARLEEIDPTVPDLLYAAWEEIGRKGPAAVSKTAHCAVEALDRTLRAAAPEKIVLGWHTTTKRPANELSEHGNVTHPLRIRYLGAQAGGAKKLIVEQYESLVALSSALRSRLEGAKHASIGDLTSARNLLMTTEAFLSVLFVSSEA